MGIAAELPSSLLPAFAVLNAMWVITSAHACACQGQARKMNQQTICPAHQTWLFCVMHMCHDFRRPVCARQGVARINGPADDAHRLPNTLSIGIRGLSAAAALDSLADTLAASAGAACHAAGSGGDGDACISGVLQAMAVRAPVLLLTPGELGRPVPAPAQVALLAGGKLCSCAGGVGGRGVPCSRQRPRQ